MGSKPSLLEGYHEKKSSSYILVQWIELLSLHLVCKCILSQAGCETDKNTSRVQYECFKLKIFNGKVGSDTAQNMNSHRKYQVSDKNRLTLFQEEPLFSLSSRRKVQHINRCALREDKDYVCYSITGTQSNMWIKQFCSSYLLCPGHISSQQSTVNS